MTIHKPVLFFETLASLNLKEGMICVDATLGGGGHAGEILKRIGLTGRLVAFDADQKAIESFRSTVGVSRAEKNGQLILVNENFRQLRETLKELQIEKVDAVLADLGYSSDQIENRQRGLSFQYAAPLDMRFDQRQELTAGKVVNEYSEAKLSQIIKEYGEEEFHKKIARGIVRKRSEKTLQNVQELVAVIEDAIPKRFWHGRIHPATKTFQALRIEVNQELSNLREFIGSALDLIKPGGVLSIISFHSLEDRMVKEMFRENARGCICPKDFPVCACGQTPRVRIVSRRAIVASEEERKNNPRSRSAKLRVCEVLEKKEN